MQHCKYLNYFVFIGPLQQVFNIYLFFKFINKWQKEILRCAQPSSHVCDFFDICLKDIISGDEFHSILRKLCNGNKCNEALVKRYLIGAF